MTNKESKTRQKNTHSIDIIQSTDSKKTFPIVGLGASAGGLEAFTSFFKNLPPNSGMAFVVIQHLDPTQEGMLTELLQRITDMHVVQIKDNVVVKPNTVYVIPPNKSISILKGSLHLFDPVKTRGLRLPIDIFFQSLAVDQEDNSIGIILSGMGSDGSIGLKAIKQAGGLAFVQEPNSAKFAAMPSNAIKETDVDCIATIEQIPGKLISIVSQNLDKSISNNTELKTKVDLDKIVVLLREHTHHDFSPYKKTTLLRRVERRKAVHQLTETKDYIRFLQENPKEGEILFKELLIGVTNFFRDPAVWEFLKNDVLPTILDRVPNGYTLRIWTVACSTGEEAYTLAIILTEAISKLKDKKIAFQIFASDLDADAITFARKGVYTSNIAVDVSPERLSQFFTVESTGYKVRSTIRETILFASHNVLKDPPFLKLDILSCRNLLIYLESPQQQKTIPLFNYCLNPEGILILGNAETQGSSSKGFVELNGKLKIFKRNLSSLDLLRIEFPKSNSHKILMKQEPKQTTGNHDNLQALTDQVLLNHFAPSSVLVNEKGDVLYITGSTGKYLEPAAGKANWNIHAMAREGLREELPGAFRKAMKSYAPVTLHNISTGSEKQKFNFTVELRHLEKPESLNGMILIIFSDHKEAPVSKTKRSNKPQKQTEIERELNQVYESLKATREEMQAASEESKSINEELQSTNEELQSTNEELTTSKEEMQSLNEELQTVNSELQSKINDLEQATSDMKNLLRSTEIATLFLDKGLNIRRFTDSVTHIFKLRETDIGRPFTDMANDLNYPDLEDHAKEVIKSLLPVETVILAKNDRTLKTRIVPYRTLDDRINGLVITFTDITEVENLKSELVRLKK